MSEHQLYLIAGILLFGLVAQWIAWKFNLPSILLLLGFGLLAGPVTGLLDPDKLFGDLLFPIVSVSVAVILYEGGLSLRFSEIKTHSDVVRNLITVGVLVQWVLGSTAAYFLLDLGLQLSVLLGAVLTVTGPTVIGPLLRSVRPKRHISSVIKWEGILDDPVGAILAVLVFEQIMAGNISGNVPEMALGLLKTIGAGSLVGAVAAAILYYMLEHDLAPDFLQNPLSLGLVVGALMAANMIQHEAGLLAVTVMGVILANQKRQQVKHIIEFKENLRLLLISSLFIILAARITVEDIQNLSWPALAFVAVLILVIRPVVAFASSIGSSLTWKERLFIGWMAPRGIVSAAVVSAFGLALVNNGMEEAGVLISLTFLVITATVVVYSLSARPVAKLLGVVAPDPKGLLIVGAQHWTRRIAVKVKEAGGYVVVVDNNRRHVELARKEGLDAVKTNLLAENTVHELDIDGIGMAAAMTTNDEVNSLAALHLTEVLDRQSVYQLPPVSHTDEKEKPSEKVSPQLRGRILFCPRGNGDNLERLIKNGAEVHTRQVEERTNGRDFADENPDLLPLFVVKPGSVVLPIDCEKPTVIAPQDTIVVLEGKDVAELKQGPMCTD